MQRVLSSDLWRTIRARAQKARQRKAAIAYVTRDLIGLRRGDTLVVNASEGSVASGDTDAKLLRKLARKGVELYHCADLHAKVLLLNDVAVIGSGNMSASSAGGLVEAGVITDHSSTVAGIASLIEQLVQQSERLDQKRIAALCKIKVVRRGGRRTADRIQRKTSVSRLGNRTWLVGVHELARDPLPDEQRMINRAMKTLSARESSGDKDIAWVKYGHQGRLARHCREGDSLIQIWRSKGAKRPSVVLRTAPVLLKQRPKRWTRFYLREAAGRYSQVKWGSFQRLLKKLGYPKKVGPRSTHLLDQEMADAIERNWKSIAK